MIKVDNTLVQLYFLIFDLTLHRVKLPIYCLLNTLSKNKDESEEVKLAIIDLYNQWLKENNKEEYCISIN